MITTLKKYSCNDFYNFLLTQLKLLNVISFKKIWNTKDNDTENDKQLTLRVKIFGSKLSKSQQKECKQVLC